MAKTKTKSKSQQPHPHHVPLAMTFMIATVFILTLALLFVWNLFPHEPAYMPPQNATATIPLVPMPAPVPDPIPAPVPVPTTTEMQILPIGLEPISTSTKGRLVELYLLKGGSCGDGTAFAVRVPASSTPIRTTIDALLDWRDFLKGDGYFSALPEGTVLNSATLSNGVLKLEFSKELENYGGGSCNVEAIRTQIEKTAMQFGNVSKVEISVPGKTAAETLQP